MARDNYRLSIWTGSNQTAQDQKEARWRNSSPLRGLTAAQSQQAAGGRTRARGCVSRDLGIAFVTLRLAPVDNFQASPRPPIVVSL